MVGAQLIVVNCFDIEITQIGVYRQITAAVFIHVIYIKL